MTDLRNAALAAEEALGQAIETLELCARGPFRDPLYHDRVKSLGDEIGYGALMSAASYAWREALTKQGFPVGGEFTSGPCRATALSLVNEGKAALTTLRAALAEGDGLEGAVKAKNQAYEERNRLVAVLARIWPSGVAKTDIEGWDPAWHNCVYIDTPVGQASWHFHDSDAHLFEGLPPYRGAWDGHSTEEKYARLASLLNASAEGDGWRGIESAPDLAGCDNPRPVLVRAGEDVESWRLATRFDGDKEWLHWDSGERLDIEPTHFRELLPAPPGEGE